MDYIQLVEDFIFFAHNHLDLDELDMVYARNRLYDELNIYPKDEFPKPINRDVNYFVSHFTDYYKKLKRDQTTIDIKIAHLFDLVSPRPSLVADKFNSLLKKNPKLATSYLYNLGINNYYIHKKDIEKNKPYEQSRKIPYPRGRRKSLHEFSPY